MDLDLIMLYWFFNFITFSSCKTSLTHVCLNNFLSCVCTLRPFYRPCTGLTCELFSFSCASFTGLVHHAWDHTSTSHTRENLSCLVRSTLMCKGGYMHLMHVILTPHTHPQESCTSTSMAKEPWLSCWTPS